MSEAPRKIKVDVVDMTQGQYVIREGEEGDTAYIILNGEVEVVKTGHDGREVVIAILGKNEIVGEMCLFEEDSIRSASVRVISDKAQLMGVRRGDFERQIEEMPDGLRNIITILIERLRRADSRIVILC